MILYYFVQASEEMSDPDSKSASSSVDTKDLIEKRNMRTCSRCHKQYDSEKNNPFSCQYHSEVFSGETAQR